MYTVAILTGWHRPLLLAQGTTADFSITYHLMKTEAAIKTCHICYYRQKKKTKTNEENLKTRPRRFTSNCSTQFWLRRAEYKWLAMFSAALYLWKSLNTTHVSFYFALIYVWRYCDNNKRENKNHLFHLLGYCMAVTAWYSNHSATNKNSALEILLFRTQSHIK